MNMTHGKPLTTQERHEAIRRFAELNPGMSHREIAKALGVNDRTVRDVLKVRESRTSLPFSHEREIVRQELPEPVREKIREQGKAQGWTRDEVAGAVQTYKSDKVNPEYKERVLAGEAPLKTSHQAH